MTFILLFEEGGHVKALPDSFKHALTPTPLSRLRVLPLAVSATDLRSNPASAVRGSAAVTPEGIGLARTVRTYVRVYGVRCMASIAGNGICVYTIYYIYYIYI